MKFHPTLSGLWVLLTLSFFAVLSNCRHNGEQILILGPTHRARVLNRAVFLPAPSSPDDEYDSPVAYDFGHPDLSATSTAHYPLPTATISDASQSFSSLSSTVSQDSSTATTEPRSPGISNGPEIESTSTVAIQESSMRETFSTSSTSLPNSSQAPTSQTNAHRDETVTVTVTDFISGKPADAGTTYLPSSSDAQTPVSSVTSSVASDSNFSVVTITSLHTITLSSDRNSSSAEQTTLGPSTPHENATPTVGTTSNQNLTTTGPSVSSGVSIITITRTQTFTGVSNTTTEANDQSTPKEVATSTIDWPTPISRIPPFSASFNLSSVPGPVMSSDISGAVTSIQSTSAPVITYTVFQNVTVTVGEPSGTGSRETGATPTAVPTSVGVGSITTSVSGVQNTSSVHSPPTSFSSPSATESTANATVTETPVSISTEVVTITVYPTPSETTTTANGTSVITFHSNSTATATLTPYPLSNASSSAFPTPEGATTPGGDHFTTGTAGVWTTTVSTVTTNSSVIGTLLNTTSWVSTDNSQPTYVDTSCEHTQTTPRPTSTTGTSAANSSVSTKKLTVTVTYPFPSTFATTVSPTSSAAEIGTSAYPPPSGTKLPGSPDYPWGGSGPLHRLQEPDF